MNKRYQQIRRCLEPDLKKIKAFVVNNHKNGINDGEISFDPIHHYLWEVLSDNTDKFDKIKDQLKNRIRKELHIKWMLRKDVYYPSKNWTYVWVNPVEFFEFEGQSEYGWEKKICYSTHYYRW